MKGGFFLAVFFFFLLFFFLSVSTQVLIHHDHGLEFKSRTGLRALMSALASAAFTEKGHDDTKCVFQCCFLSTWVSNGLV
jgi:hypothetical protein